jgi:hypothetical protein
VNVKPATPASPSLPSEDDADIGYLSIHVPQETVWNPVFGEAHAMLNGAAFNNESASTHSFARNISNLGENMDNRLVDDSLTSSAPLDHPAEEKGSVQPSE